MVTQIVQQDILTEVFDLSDRQGLSFNTFPFSTDEAGLVDHGQVRGRETSADAECSSPVVALVYVTGQRTTVIKIGQEARMNT